MISRPPTAGAVALGALSLLGLACGGEPSPAATPVSVATIELPAPASPAPSGAPAAGAPAESASASPDPLNELKKPGGAGKTIEPESPLFIARFAAVFRTPGASAQPSVFGGDSIILFRDPVTCDVAENDQGAPDHVKVGVTWSAGQRSTFQQFVFRNGKGVKHSGSIEILSAPTNKGDVGRILIDPIPDANVKGGEIDALVCE